MLTVKVSVLHVSVKSYRRGIWKTIIHLANQPVCNYVLMPECPCAEAGPCEKLLEEARFADVGNSKEAGG